MMNKILLFSLILSPSLFAQDSTGRDAAEEAIILNQELQFLEESANNVTIVSSPERRSPQRSGPTDTQSLEERYFGNDLEDDVATRAAAPRRRGL